MKRLCIYLTYDKQNIVDEYIGYMLKELKTCADYVAVVCNETEVACGLDILGNYADEIFCRGNIGFDAGGFKDALCVFLGWEKVLQYDELVLVNDSMFGPFKPMKDIFAEMNKKEADFWGLAVHGETNLSSLGYVAEHVQSYFMVIRRRMLHSYQFMDYWKEMPYFATYNETIMGHEIKFTQYFSRMGFTYSSLADTKANDSISNYAQYAYISYELIRKRNFPFFKKQQISSDTLFWQTQENLRQSIDYINEETCYDVNFIWDNIIRTLNVSDIYRSFHLRYIIPAGDISFGQADTFCRHLAVIVFAAHEEAAEYVLEYLQELKLNCTIIIFSEKDSCLEAYAKQGFECRYVEHGLCGIAELLADFSSYDYVCVLNDTDMTSDRNPSCVGKSYFYNVWENLLKNTSHVIGIMECFAKEPRLGYLAPPQPVFADYFGECGKEWNGKFGTVRRIAEELNLNCQLSEMKEPFRVTADFWVRGCVLKKIIHMKTEDNPFLPYMWSYIAQDAGYYSGIVESIGYASMNEVNLQHYLCQAASQVRRQCGGFASFSEMKESMLSSALTAFCGKYRRIFIYGVGEMAQKYKGILPDVEAYIVSDGQEKQQDVDGVPVKYLSEINVPDDCGVVLLLNRKNQMQVVPLLEAHGIKNYFCA